MLISKYNKIRLRSDRHPKKNVKENFFVTEFFNERKKLWKFALS